MIRTKPLDMEDLARKDFALINEDYNKTFGPRWPVVPCRRWEYTGAIVFSDILKAERDVKVCDGGSGANCAFTKYLGHKGFIVDAFDYGISASTMNFCGGGRINYSNMSLHDIKLDDAIYDYVFCMSSIEHINACERFKIEGMVGEDRGFQGDIGDTQGMMELCRILKPGGVLVLTTDYAKEYIPPPGPANSHRVYSWESILKRLVNPVVRKYNMTVWGGYETECNWETIDKIEPMGWRYTEFILTMRKKLD